MAAWSVAVVLAGIGVGLFWWHQRETKKLHAQLRVGERRLTEATRVNQQLAQDLSEVRQSREQRALTRGHGDTFPKIPGPLAVALAKGECVLVAGTGLAEDARLPTWRQALHWVVRHQKNEHPGPQWQPLAAEIESGRPDVAEVLIGKDLLTRRRLLELLKEAVAERQEALDEPPYPALGKLGFAGILNTLWDELPARLLPAAHEAVQIDASTSSRVMANVLLKEKQQFFRLDAYGSLKAGTFRLSANELAAALAEQPELAPFLGTLVGTRTLLFVGADVAGIEGLLRAATPRGGSRAEHFAILPWSPEVDLERERLKRLFNVHLLDYPDGSLGAMLDALAKERGKVAETVEEQPAGTAPLEAIRLRDIGPFRELKLEFGSRWNIVLGNNGAGKSTVVRAIALALCGDDPRALEVGGRVLRAGAKTGLIELRMGGSLIQTVLERGPSGVRVIPQLITPLQTGQWLVLAFPPVRGLGVRTPGGDTPADTVGSTVGDVLPLVTGEVDQRLEDVERWLLQLYDRYEGDADPPAVERFFDVLTWLSAGRDEGDDVPGRRRLRVARRDQEKQQIIVETPDGEVPLGLLSQGMSSILSWTGTLIARLDDMGLLDPDAAGTRRAVVLIDEIDAHLHPAWQRRIVTAIDHAFPGLQVIATTHSPLVVGSLEDEPVDEDEVEPRVPEKRLWRLYRDDGDELRHEELALRYRGWRADEILAARPFDTSPRDPETEHLLTRYADLAVMGERTAEQERDLHEITAQLEFRLPTKEESAEAATAHEMIVRANEEKLATMAEGERQRVLDELLLQVQEAITGSRPHR